MKYSVFSKSVVGYKNKVKDKSSQDYLIYKILDRGVLCAIADGHSGDYFTFSHKGSKIACEAFIEIMEEHYKKKEKFDSMCVLLSKQAIQREICNKWRDMVCEDFRNSLPRVYRMDYFRYGTTLLGLYIDEEYRFFMRIGDGEILIKRNDQFKKIFRFENKPLVDTLAENEAYKKIQYKIEKINNMNNDFPIVIYSDGYENSFLSYTSMINNMEDTISKYNKSIFSRMILQMNYEKDLIKLSKIGSRDDISIAFVNIL